MDIDTITHKKCLQLTLKLLRYEVKYQHDLIRNIEAPQNLGFFKTILWQLTTGKQKKAACKKEIQKAQSYIYDVEYVLSLLRSYEYVEDAYGYYDEIADREHSIADQWNYGGPTNQAHIREGNKYRHRANNLAKGYQLALDAHLHYFKVLSKRIYG